MIRKGKEIKKPWMVTMYYANPKPSSECTHCSMEIGRFRWGWMARLVAWLERGIYNDVRVMEIEAEYTKENA